MFFPAWEMRTRAVLSRTLISVGRDPMVFWGSLRFDSGSVLFSERRTLITVWSMLPEDEKHSVVFLILSGIALHNYVRAIFCYFGKFMGWFSNLE